MRKESKDKKGDFIEEKNLQRLRVPRAHTCTAACKCGHFQQGGEVIEGEVMIDEEGITQRSGAS